jgi:uncharacterized protein
LSRFILDANIVLAALAGRAGAPPALLLTGVHNGDLDAVACPLLIEEIRENLGKPYFRARITGQRPRKPSRHMKPSACCSPTQPTRRPCCATPRMTTYLPSRSPRVARAIITGDRDLLDHAGLLPPAIDARTACELTRLLERR